jgi:small subunit ribosomal protein S1
LRLNIIELDSEQRRFVLSERATCLDESQRRELLNKLCPGDICQGHVTNLCPFGVFVDLGGLEGLVHISELSWGRVDRPSDVLELGQSVEVYVLDVDRGRGRVGLSIKRLQPDPWQLADERYQVDQAIQGVVTHVVDFGGQEACFLRHLGCW